MGTSDHRSVAGPLISRGLSTNVVLVQGTARTLSWRIIPFSGHRRRLNGMSD